MTHASPQPVPPDDALPLFPLAKEAAGKLRAWILRAYSLDAGRIPEGLALSLDHLDLAISEGRFCGYSLVGAPAECLNPIAAYLQALRRGRPGKRMRGVLPIYLLREHQSIVRGLPRKAPHRSQCPPAAREPSL